MGFSGDFFFERLDGGKVRVRDKFTKERIGDIWLPDEDIKVVGKKKRGRK